MRHASACEAADAGMRKLKRGEVVLGGSLLSLPWHCHAYSILDNGVCLSEKIRKVVWGGDQGQKIPAGSVADVVLASIEVRKVAEGGHTHTRISACMCPRGSE